MPSQQKAIPSHDVTPEPVRTFTPPEMAAPAPGRRGSSPAAEIFGSLVRDIMTRKVVTVEATDTLEFAATLIKQKDISGMPVVEKDGRVVGVLSEKDILRALRDRAGLTMPGGLFELILDPSAARQKDLLVKCRSVLQKVKVGEAMTSPAKTISPDTLTVQAARQMLTLHINRMPVVENGKLVGIVSRANVLTLYEGPF